MASLAEAVTRICDDYLNRPEDDIGATVAREVQLAVDHYAPQRMGFNEARLTFTLSSTSGYSLATIATDSGYSKVLEIDNVFVQHSSTREYELMRVTWGELAAYRTAPTIVGSPSAYSVHGNTLYLDSVPSQENTAYIDCLLQFIPVANATNGWLDEGLELIMCRAASQASKKRLQDVELYQTYAQLEADALAALLGRAVQQTSAGRLRASL